jgi:hypothetical protein
LPVSSWQTHFSLFQRYSQLSATAILVSVSARDAVAVRADEAHEDAEPERERVLIGDLEPGGVHRR